MKTIEQRVDEYARSQCDGDCALCEDICRMTSNKRAFVDGAESERKVIADEELFTSGVAEYYALYANDDKSSARKHFAAGADWMRAELTRWHDPKEELPDSNKTVLVKVIDELDNESIYLGTREGDEYIIDDAGEFRVGVCFDNESMPDMNVKVIGWREIHE